MRGTHLHDHVALLAELARKGERVDVEDVTRRGRALHERLRALGHERLRADVSALLQAANAPGQTGLAAQAGLGALTRNDALRLDPIPPMALRSATFLGGLFHHWVARSRGDTAHAQAAPLPASARERVDREVSDFEVADRSDGEWAAAARGWVGQSTLPEKHPIVRRMFRNAEFLAVVLETPDERVPDDVARARAAIAWLTRGPARQDVLEAVEDAYVLDQAVTAIEPAREPWIRLIQATTSTWPVLSQLTTGDRTLVLSRSILQDAALLAEPLAVSQGTLDDALFVPAAGSVPLLLGLVGALEYLFELDDVLREADSEVAPDLDRLSWLARNAPRGPFVLVVAPTGPARSLFEGATLGGRPLTSVLPCAEVLDDRSLRRLGPAGGPALLLVCGQLSLAASLLADRPDDARLVIVDLALAGAEEGVDTSPVRTRTLRSGDHRPATTDLYETYAEEAGDIDRMSVDRESVLSIEAIAARAEILEAAVDLGPTVDQFFEADNVRAEELLSHFRNLWADGEPDRAETMAALDALGMADEGYRAVLKGLDHDVRQLLTLRMMTDPVTTARRLDEIGRRIRVPADRFLEAADRVTRAGARLDRVVDEFTQRNLRLVLWMARKYRNRTFYLDMIQEGNVGLMRAARKFDHRKGAKFGSYAGWWIRQSIEGFLSRHSRTIRIPVNTLGLMRRIGRAEIELAEAKGRSPTDDELAAHTGIPVDEVTRARRVAYDIERGCVALDGPVDQEGGATLNELIPDTETVLAPDHMDNVQMETEARRLLETLDDVESQVLHLRFGIGDDERFTLAEVGDRIGLTKERIRQIELKALGKLRFRAKRLGVRP